MEVKPEQPETADEAKPRPKLGGLYGEDNEEKLLFYAALAEATLLAVGRHVQVDADEADEAVELGLERPRSCDPEAGAAGGQTRLAESTADTEYLSWSDTDVDPS